jgi:hypothetical protein
MASHAVVREHQLFQLIILGLYVLGDAQKPAKNYPSKAKSLESLLIET